MFRKLILTLFAALYTSAALAGGSLSLVGAGGAGSPAALPSRTWNDIQQSGTCTTSCSVSGVVFGPTCSGGGGYEIAAIWHQGVVTAVTIGGVSASAIASGGLQSYWQVARGSVGSTGTVATTGGTISNMSLATWTVCNLNSITATGSNFSTSSTFSYPVTTSVNGVVLNFIIAGGTTGNIPGINYSTPATFSGTSTATQFRQSAADTVAAGSSVTIAGTYTNLSSTDVSVLGLR